MYCDVCFCLNMYSGTGFLEFISLSAVGAKKNCFQFWLWTQFTFSLIVSRWKCKRSSGLNFVKNSIETLSALTIKITFFLFRYGSIVISGTERWRSYNSKKEQSRFNFINRECFITKEEGKFFAGVTCGHHTSSFLLVFR